MPFPFRAGQRFSMLLNYSEEDGGGLWRIALDGAHFTEFRERVPLRVRGLLFRDAKPDHSFLAGLAFPQY